MGLGGAFDQIKQFDDREKSHTMKDDEGFSEPGNSPVGNKPNAPMEEEKTGNPPLSGTIGPNNPGHGLIQGQPINKPSNPFHVSTHNTYKIFLNNEFPDIVPQTYPETTGSYYAYPPADQLVHVTEWPLADTDVSQPITKCPAVNLQLPWRYLPNNNIFNYMKPKDIYPALMAGATDFRIKSLSLQLHGLYNMLHYDATGQITIQQQPPAYVRVCMPGSGVQNQRANKALASPDINLLLNPNARQDFIHADPELAAAYGLPQGEVYGNKLHPCFHKVLLNPRPKPDGQDQVYTQQEAEQYVQRNWEYLFPDLERFATIQDLNDGDKFSWSWENKDKKWVNLSKAPLLQQPLTGESLVQSTTRDQFQPSYKNMTAQTIRGFPTMHHSNVSDILLNVQDQITNEITPILISIPQLPNKASGQNVVHAAHGYVTYKAEIEFKREMNGQVWTQAIKYGDVKEISDGAGNRVPYTYPYRENNGVVFDACNVTQTDINRLNYNSDYANIPWVAQDMYIPSGTNNFNPYKQCSFDTSQAS
jgi:hypothetical protein